MSYLPNWANEVIASYESKSAGCFLLHGNINDRLLVSPPKEKTKLGNLTDFILETLLPRFDVVIIFDMGFGLRVAKGTEIFSKWKTYADTTHIPDKPLNACRFVSKYLL